MPDAISRRTFLRGVAGVGAAGVLATTLDPLPRRAEAALMPVGMAMHVHSSFSEGTGSMFSQLVQAGTNQVDVVWWTEHDWRMSGYGYRQVVHFSGMTENEGNLPITWSQSKTGSFNSASAMIVSSPASPLDPEAPSSMKLSAVGKGSSSFATLRCTANASSARENLRGSLAGMTIQLEVYPESISSNAFLEIKLKTSSHPATAGRPAGAYTIAYRVGGPDAPGTYRASGIAGTVTLGAPTGAWTSLTLTPTADIARLWPDLQPQDGSLYEFSLAASSKARSAAVGYVDYLRFSRPSGAAQMQTQRQLMTAYAPSYPTVTQLQGSEVSLYQDHLNWFGGSLALPDYGTAQVLPTPNDPAATSSLVSAIHAGGGLASFNHMFGSNTPALLSAAKQDSLRRAMATKLISSRVYGADLLEVGYQSRAGVNLARHVGVWDACSRNGIFTTGTGVNDSHGGGWTGQQNNFLTWAWAEGKAESSLMSALASGRCYFADLGFRGRLDLTVDGFAPMGSASVADLASRQLQIVATGLPSGGSVRLVQGPVDFAGAAVPDPGTVTATLPVTEFATGSVTVSIDTSASRFARVEVVDASGKFLAGSNPVWMLRAAPPSGIPTARIA